MSVTSSLWTGVSGLLAHGEKMNVVGNNIANVNTVGFKSQRMDFADFVYQDAHSVAGPTQIGRGVKVGTIIGNFAQGAFESTTNATDLAIEGKGFFQVQAVGSDEAYYTRAGNFTFDKEGYLKDPNGFALQGWKIDNSGGVMQATGGNANAVNAGSGSTSPIKGSGVPTDIQLDTFTVFPQQTTKMDFKVNLPKSGADNAVNTSNPFAALFNQWNGNEAERGDNVPPLAQTSYAEQTTMQIYDEAGVKHTITVYFDKVSSTDYKGGNSGEEVWEYIVTMDPAEDKRQFWDEATGELKNVNETKAGGLLMSGTFTFNSAGAIVNQSAYVWGGTQSPEYNPDSFTDVPDPAGGTEPKKVINLDPTDMKNWQPAPVSSSGYPIVVPNFSGILDAQTSGTQNGAKYNTEINFGLRASNLSQPWSSQGSLADMNVDPYQYNAGYNKNKPETGPEYIKLNPAYDASKEEKWLPHTGRYLIDDTKATWAFSKNGNAMYTALQGDLETAAGLTGGALTDTNYLLALELYGVDKITIKADEYGAGTPNQNLTLDLRTGDILADDGTDLGDWGATVAGLNTADPGTIQKIAQKLNTTLDGSTPKNMYVYAEATPSNANMLADFTEPAVIEAYASTNLDGAFSSSNAQNGYGFGDLTSWSVDSDGILHGIYSNGIDLPLWQITMYDFTNTQGLRREGNNLYSETLASGYPKTGAAGNSGLGNISSYTLEQSNVDLATEFVYMISTQRGYQSNSKMITTVDTMLETVINMKR